MILRNALLMPLAKFPMGHQNIQQKVQPLTDFFFFPYSLLQCFAWQETKFPANETKCIGKLSDVLLKEYRVWQVTVWLKCIVFWDITPSCLVQVFWKNLLPLLLVCSADGNGRSQRNDDIYLLSYVADIPENNTIFTITNVKTSNLIKKILSINY